MPRHGADGEVRPGLRRCGGNLLGAAQVTIGDADLPHGCADKCGNGGARGASCAKDQRGARGASSIEQRIKCAAESSHVSVPSNKTASGARDRIDGADRCGLFGH